MPYSFEKLFVGFQVSENMTFEIEKEGGGSIILISG
jgi:hypothetical protein